MCGDTIVITIRAGTSGKGVSRRFRSKKTSTCGPSCVIRGTECLAGKPRRPRGSLAVVFGGGIRRWEACGHVASRPDSAQQGLARLGQPAAKRIRIGGVAEVYRAWYALWKRVMATCHGRAIGAGSESSSAWSTPTPREKVECPLCPPFVTFPLSPPLPPPAKGSGRPGRSSMRGSSASSSGGDKGDILLFLL